MNISFLIKHIEEIVKINDVLLPPSIQRFINTNYSKYNKELFKNQEEFIYKYRHGHYSKENESYIEEEERLFKELFKKHPSLIPLRLDSLDTYEEKDDNIEFYDF